METSPSMATPPDAMTKLSRVVELTSGGHVVVLPWNFRRATVVAGIVALPIANLKPEVLKLEAPRRTEELYKLLGERALTIAQLSVRDQDAARLEQLPYRDFLAVFRAALEINDLLEAVGGVTEVGDVFVPRFGGANETTPSSPPSASSAAPE
jgi:hypothetical protein